MCCVRAQFENTTLLYPIASTNYLKKNRAIILILVYYIFSEPKLLRFQKPNKNPKFQTDNFRDFSVFGRQCCNALLKIRISNIFHLSNGFNYAIDACQSIATQLAQTNPVDFKDKESGDNAEMRHGKGGKSHRQGGFGKRSGGKGGKSGKFHSRGLMQF